MIADIDAPEPAEEKINAYLAAHADEVDGIVTTAWVPAVVASNALRKIGDKRIKMVGIDHDEVVLKAIKDGFVHGTMLQNPYGQGYIGSFAVDKLRSRLHGEGRRAVQVECADRRSSSIRAPSSSMRRSVDNYVSAMQGITKTLMADFEKTYLDCK